MLIFNGCSRCHGTIQEDWIDKGQNLCVHCGHIEYPDAPVVLKAPTRICSECPKPAVGRGLCDAHYKKLRRYGSPSISLRMRRARYG
jgi:hypothetical protein